MKITIPEVIRSEVGDAQVVAMQAYVMHGVGSIRIDAPLGLDETVAKAEVLLDTVRGVRATLADGRLLHFKRDGAVELNAPEPVRPPEPEPAFYRNRSLTELSEVETPSSLAWTNRRACRTWWFDLGALGRPDDPFGAGRELIADALSRLQQANFDGAPVMTVWLGQHSEAGRFAPRIHVTMVRLEGPPPRDLLSGWGQGAATGTRDGLRPVALGAFPEVGIREHEVHRWGMTEAFVATCTYRYCRIHRLRTGCADPYTQVLSRTDAPTDFEWLRR